MTDQVNQEVNEQVVQGIQVGEEAGKTKLLLEESSSGIIFTSAGMQVILPKDEGNDPQTQFHASLVAGIVLRLRDEAWVEDIITWMNSKVSSTSDEDLLKEFSGKEGANDN